MLSNYPPNIDGSSSAGNTTINRSTTDVLSMFSYGIPAGNEFSSKSVTVTMTSETQLQGEVAIEDVPAIHEIPSINSRPSSRLVSEHTIICDTLVAHEIHTLPSTNLPRQMFQVNARTTENKKLFAHDAFASCIRVAAAQMAHNHQNEDSRILDKYGRIGFWSPRIKILYSQAMHIYKQLCNQGDPSMTLDEVHVEARLSVKPFTLSLKLCELPYSSMRTCQVRVAKGSRPPSFLPDYQLSNDPQGFTKLIVPPIADVVLVHPQSQKITQGLLSSFYATKYTAPIATARQGGTTTGRADLRNYTLVCAPLQEKQPNAATTNGNGDGNDSTIDDVVAKALWMICKRDGIAVSFSGVTLEDIMKRRVSGVFIANTTLNVLPIDTMYLTDRRRTVIEIGSCPLATHLQESIIKHLHPLEHHHIQDI